MQSFIATKALPMLIFWLILASHWWGLVHSSATRITTASRALTARYLHQTICWVMGLCSCPKTTIRSMQQSRSDSNTRGVHGSEWGSLGLPFSPMIGLPCPSGGGSVVKYFINGQTPSRVVRGTASQPTATQTSVTQQGGRTILTFIRPVPEDNEGSVIVGSNRIMWVQCWHQHHLYHSSG
jgi:hypothetical protein